MEAEAVAYVFAVMLFMAAYTDRLRNPGYRCPACDTTNPREHSKDCSWSKHYGEGD